MKSHLERSKFNPSNKWTDKEIQFIQDHNDSMSTREIAEALGRSYSATNKRMSILGIKKNIGGNGSQFHPGNKWTEVEVDYLRENYSKMTNKRIAYELGKTSEAVRAKARSLNLKKKK